ncbi:hypothetical protein BAY60_06265 [Prauserella muralis]|uniref:Peptidase M48 domain-containing protein n=1 Tax=Prauserella muralis TaxID=588067 RepID=A0A2V4B9I0_9PSEU|nr:hypothetical protein BAY60_06265 [Prauserella muralis]
MLLLALFPVFVVGVGAGAVIAGLRIGQRTGLYLVIAGAGMALALGFALVQALRTRLVPPEGPKPARHEQPGLWRLVDELAAQAGTRPPEEIVLVPEVNAAVREDARLLGLRPGRRYLMLGLPLLAALDVAELRAVLAHELGHYGGGHTRLLAASYRGAETLGRTLSRLDAGPAKWILTGYGWVYAVLSRSANRAQELQADAYAVAAAGRAATACALRRTATLDAAWNAFTDRYLRLPGLAQRTPDILLGFRAFLGHPRQRQALAALERRVLDTRPRSLLDSHPTVRRRLAAIDRLPETPAHPDPRPAWQVLAEPGTVIPAAEQRLYISGELGPRASWAEIVRLAGAAEAARGAELLANAARTSGAAPGATLGEILQAVHRGEAERLIRPLLGPRAGRQEVAQAVTEGLAELLADVVVCALLVQCRARHELDWGEGWRVIGPTGELRPVELAAQAVGNPALAPRFAQQCVTLGVPLDFVPPPAGRPASRRPGSAGEPRLMAAAPVVRALGKNWDVLVYDTGLLLIPVKVAGLAGQRLAAVSGQAGHWQRKRIEKLLAHGTQRRLSHPGARWLAIDTMLGGDHKKFLTGGGKVALRFADGQTATLRTEDDAGYAALVAFLDALPQALPHRR